MIQILLWNNFRTTFNYVADIHAPIQGRKVRNMNAPWLTDAIKKSMNCRDYLKKKAVKTNSHLHTIMPTKAYAMKLTKNHPCEA